MKDKKLLYRERKWGGVALSLSLCCLPLNGLAKSIELKDLNVTAKAPIKPITKNSEFQGGKTLSKESIKSFATPKKGITDLLKTNPNASFANSQSTAKNQGELDAQDISINGARFYQNKFTIDGISINNDLNPATRVFNQNNVEDVGSSSSRGMIGEPMPDIGSVSQGINIDPDLIDSIEVHDSSVSAKFGGFQGGVVESKTRNPRKGFHGKVSTSYTSSSMAKEIIDEQEKIEFENSSRALFQPKFKKQKHTLELEGYLSENFGVLFNYTKQQSTIPLTAFHENFQIYANADNKQNQIRKNENLFLKFKYFPTDEITITPTIIKAPSSAVYNDYTSINSKQTYLSGGTIASIDVDWEFNSGKLKQVLGYSNLVASKDAEHEFYKLYGNNLMELNPTTRQRERVFKTDANEGGYGDIDQSQRSISYKADLELDKRLLFKFKDLDIEHTFSSGFEIKKTIAKYDVKKFSVYESPKSKLSYNTKTQQFNTFVTECATDEEACVIEDDVTTLVRRGFQMIPEKQRRGYFFTTKKQYEGKTEIKVNEFALYLQDEIEAGRFNIRPGLRVETDNYTRDFRIAPRFATSLNLEDTTFSFGLNRYYGRLPYAFELKNNKEKLLTFYKKEGYDTDGSYDPDKYGFVVDNKKSTKKTRLYQKLKVPYDDELALGVSHNLGNYNMALKYIHRIGKNQIFDSTALTEGLTREEFRNSHNKNEYIDFKNIRMYTNKGQSTSDIYTFALSNIRPISLTNSTHKFELGLNYTKKRSNSFAYNTFLQGTNDVPEIYIDGYDYKASYDYIKLDGKYIKIKDAPASDFSRDWTLVFSTISSFPKLNMTLGNTFRIQAPLKKVEPVYIQTKDSSNRVVMRHETTDYNGQKVGSYMTRKISNPYFNWDMRVGFEFNMPKKSQFFVNLDILNVLNRRNKTSERNIHISDISRAPQYINTYESGRQFWIEGGFKW